MKISHLSMFLFCAYSFSSCLSAAPPSRRNYYDYYREGVELLKEGICEGASLRLRKSLEINPTTQAWNNLGVALECTGRLQEALEAYEAAKKLAIKRKDKKAITTIEANIKGLTKILTLKGVNNEKK